MQQSRYFGFDDCIFAGELAYVVVDMRDIAGNVVPFSDTEAFYDLFTVEFVEQGSEFSVRECEQYGPVADALIICKVRPLSTGIGTLDIKDTNSRIFKSFP